MSEPFERWGVPRIVNAKGPSTRLSGGPLRPEVRTAMAKAGVACVDIVELQAAAARIIARHTGAESGLVTNGAAAGLLLGTAACVAGSDPAAMARLPEIATGRDEVVVVRSQRNQYDHAIRTAGVRIVEVGLPDRVAGAGVRDAESWELAAAIGPRTAAVLWVAGSHARPELPEVVEVARAGGVPVLVDAAAQLPPRANLRRFIAEGADLVAFSGGKAIGGPQASGILCGRRDLVASAALQMFDMDYPEGLFRPPSAFIDTGALKGLPPHGLGRVCKVGREEIAGLLTALELWAAEDEAAEHGRWVARLEEVAAAIGGSAGPALMLQADSPVPRLVLGFAGEEARRVREIYQALREDPPRIETDPAELHLGNIVIGPACLLEGDAAIIGRRMRELLRR